MGANAERVATRWLGGGARFSRGRARELLRELDGAGLRWNRDWWLVLESLADGEPVNADEYNYAFHAVRRDITRAEAASLDAKVTASLTELRDVFAARI